MYALLTSHVLENRCVSVVIQFRRNVSVFRFSARRRCFLVGAGPGFVSQTQDFANMVVVIVIVNPISMVEDLR